MSESLFYKGRGEHSVNELERLIEGFKAKAEAERHEIKCPACKVNFWFVQNLKPNTISVPCSHAIEGDQLQKRLDASQETLTIVVAERNKLRERVRELEIENETLSKALGCRKSREALARRKKDGKIATELKVSSVAETLPE